MTPAFIMHAGRIMKVRAQCKTNGLPAVLVEDQGGERFIVPLALATEASAPAAAPQRRGIRLVCQDGVRV